MGDDIIYCGAGNDQFVFYAGDGQNIIIDFSITMDNCYVANNVGNKVDIIEYENVSKTQNIDGNAVLTLFDGTSITLEGISHYLPIAENIDSGLVA